MADEGTGEEDKFGLISKCYVDHNFTNEMEGRTCVRLSDEY